MKLILGSQSEGRRKILENAGYSFMIMNPDINEKAIRSEDYSLLPLLLAREKAKALLPKIAEPSILITSDQVVVCNGELREKPADETRARRYLQSYNQFPAQTNTAVVVMNTTTGKLREAVDTASIYFKHIPENVIEKLVKRGHVMYAAGAIIAEHPLLKPYIQKIEGDSTSVTGLPLRLTQKFIDEVSG